MHTYDAIQEEEASWLGSCLQAPIIGLVWALKNKMDHKQTADWFNASPKMISYRMSVTGVSKQIISKL